MARQMFIWAGALGNQSLNNYGSWRALRYRVVRGLVAKVGLVELGVMAAVRQQLCVAAVLNDFAVCHVNDAAGRAHSGKAVGNLNTRAALEN